MGDPEYHITVGFVPGLIIGMVFGTLVFGVSVIGQGLWEEGRRWGETHCEEARHEPAEPS